MVRRIRMRKCHGWRSHLNSMGMMIMRLRLWKHYVVWHQAVDMNKNFFADEWNHVFATPRMLKLIELIKKYQDEGEFEEDAIVEAILNESRDGEDIEMIDKSEKSPNTNQKKSTKENKKSTKENQKKKQKRNTKPKNNKKSTNGTGAKKNNRREPRPAARRA
eukprot:290917_1